MTANAITERRTVTYHYDGLLRLTGATSATTNRYRYGYDLAGNRTSVTTNGITTTFTYNTANQITNSGYRYDQAGNLLSDGTATYSYDPLNRLTSSGNGRWSSHCAGNGPTILAQPRP